MNTIENLKALLAKGHESALLRFSLGSAYLREKNHFQAIEHLSRAVELDPGYSAAWKLYGKALAGEGRIGEAAAAYERGIVAAEKKGDLQAAREMKVFLKRLKK